MSVPPAHVIHDSALDELTSLLLSQRSANERTCIGIAGIPGSGKSTLGTMLMDRVQRLAPGTAVLVPMDGFHLSNRCLTELDLVYRKGAPATFDVDGYLELLKRARSPGSNIPFPVYDRKRHEPVMDHTPEHTIAHDVRLVLTEGNYLLLDTHPWSRLESILDACWFLETPQDVARAWTIDRHIRGGRSPADATAQYERNDALNTRLVLDHMRRPDLILRWDTPS